jgi:exonuclease III
MTWNANGILGKLGELKVFLKMHDVDIMLITETKLLKTDKLNIDSYNILRKERNTDTRGGGVAILVKRGIPYIKAQVAANEIECTAIKLSNNVVIAVVYNRPCNKYKIESIRKICNNSYMLTLEVLAKSAIQQFLRVLYCAQQLNQVPRYYRPSRNRESKTAIFFYR